MVGRRLSSFIPPIRSQIVDVAKEPLPARGGSFCHRNKVKGDFCAFSAAVSRGDPCGEQKPPGGSTASPQTRQPCSSLQTRAVVPCPPWGHSEPPPREAATATRVQGPARAGPGGPRALGQDRARAERSVAASRARHSPPGSVPSGDPGWGPAASAHPWSHRGASLGPAAAVPAGPCRLRALSAPSPPQDTDCCHPKSNLTALSLALRGAGEPGRVPKSSEPRTEGWCQTPAPAELPRSGLLPRTPTHPQGRCCRRMFIIPLVPSVR